MVRIMQVVPTHFQTQSSLRVVVGQSRALVVSTGHEVEKTEHVQKICIHENKASATAAICLSVPPNIGGINLSFSKTKQHWYSLPRVIKNSIWNVPIYFFRCKKPRRSYIGHRSDHRLSLD